jgi:Tol biopolymer transport system component
VFVLAVDGSRESSIVAQPADDRVVDWAEDTVLFTSDRSGATGLWAVPGSGGVAREIRPNVSGRGFITDSGTLFMGSMFALRDVFTATMNFDNGQIDADAVNPVPKFIGANRMPRWSPDGKSMAFLSTRKGYENSLVGILSNETAQVREIGEGMATIWQMRWAPNGKSIYVSGNSTKGQPGIYRMDARGGALPELVVPDANDTRHSLDVSADGTKLYYLLGAGGGGGTLVEWSLSESKGREVLALKGMDFLSVSPDGKWIAARVPNPSEEESALWVAPIRGGASRQLFSGMTRYAFVSWADAESMIVQKGDENWQVFLSDRAPRKLPIPLGQGPVHVHPDGKQIAFWRDVSRAELSVLENFLP